ncbi:MAG: hypothetical protein N2444_00075 [Methylocystis sp.]|nr:hypothetical protein [Methylocystis sp.]
MSIAQEALEQAGGLKPTLAAGLDFLSGGQEVTFSLYRRFVLPLDGYVFWVRDPEEPPRTWKGSLHYESGTNQAEDETAAFTRVVFTSLSPIDDLSAVSPQSMWIGEYDGLKIGFSSRGRYYRQADLHHYSGAAILPALQSQIVESAADLPAEKLIVSNSLPAFLFLNDYIPPYPTPLQIGGLVTLYPSFAVPANLPPPYAAVHIERTENMQGAPWMNSKTQTFALSYDDVKITTYGLDNADVLTLRDAILQYSYDWSAIGVMDWGAVQDEKRPQSEFGILAQKKTMTLRVSYMQTTMRDIARQMIETVSTAFAPQPY